ncbi:MAG: molybdopterin-dependent oxidoreductase [Nitrospirales bacterium]
MKLSRRTFLQVTAAMAAASAVPVPPFVRAGVLDRLFGSPQPQKLTPAITSNEEFYVTSYRSPPTVRVEEWELQVGGLVENPLTLNYAELLARPKVSEIVTLECVGNTVAGEFISTAEWEGLSLRTMLEEVKPASDAYDVVFHAADGYADGITLERAMAGDVLIAVKMNGVPLPQGHGFPVRMIVPGVYGMKSVQWLTKIELIAGDYKGYYQKKGWTDDATIRTMSRIDLPLHGDAIHGGAYFVKGLAFAGVRGIQALEVSTDGGQIWNPATLGPPLSPYAWQFWSYDWRIASPGRHTLVVRATDRDGRVQSSLEQEPYPDGATGLQEVTVKVID